MFKKKIFFLSFVGKLEKLVLKKIKEMVEFKFESLEFI